MKQLPFLLIIVFISLGISSCKVLMGPAGLGDRALEFGEYNDAVNYYLKAIEKGKDNGKVNFNLAESYRQSNRIHLALPFYQRAALLEYENETLPFYLGQALKANQEYDKAMISFRQYLATGEDRALIALARYETRNLTQVSELPNKEKKVQVSNLANLNTAYPEYGFVFYNDEIYFTSTRSGGKEYKGTGTPFSNIYKAKFDGFPMDSLAIEPLAGLADTPEINEGSVAIHPDGKIMVFARGNSGNKKGASDVNLYISYFRDNQWTEPELMNINDPDAWDASPSFSLDGSTLYFASNRAGGIGGIDLYSARLDDRGNWTGVRNLGSSINTPGNELFPYVGPDEKLYFASDGHPGLGGLDLFVATREEGEVAIENLGSPFNSNYDDFGLVYTKFPYEGIFVSNRPGGLGDDDLYFFQNKADEVKIINYIIAGKTRRIDDEGTKINLPAVRVKLLDSAGNVVQEATSGLSGDFNFVVQPEKSYTLSAEKTDFFLKRQDFSTLGKTVDPSTVEELQTNVAFDVEMILEAIVIDKAIVLENIYYDFDRADIREDAALELDKLVQILKDNPDIRIELSAHTDNRGSDAYNQRLSQQRAESAVNYIVSKGIDAARITARGYGASRPIAPNSNPDGSDNPEGRQLNRRTEFKVVSVDNRN